MDRNKALSQINDLLIMLLAGIAMYISQTHLVDWEFTRQLIALTGFTFIAGLFMSRGSQLLEWFVFFLLGGLLATAIEITYPLLGNFAQINPQLYIEPLIMTGTWYFYLLIAFFIGLPAGALVNRMVVGDYWVRKNIYLGH